MKPSPSLRSAVAQVFRRRAAAQRFRRCDDVAARQQQRIVGLRRPVEIEHARDAARRGRLADRDDEIRIAVVEHNDVGRRHRLRRICRRDVAQALVAAGGDHLFAGRVDQDQRHRGGRAGNAHGVAAIDLLAPQALDDTTSEFVVVVAERAGEADRAAKPGRCNGGIAGLAAAGDQEFRRLHLGAGVGEFVDPHHDILHGAAGAENAGRVCSVSQNGSRPPPRRG